MFIRRAEKPETGSCASELNPIQQVMCRGQDPERLCCDHLVHLGSVESLIISYFRFWRRS